MIKSIINKISTQSPTLSAIKQDADRYYHWYRDAGFWIGTTYRVGHYRLLMPRGVLRKALYVPYSFMNFIWESLFYVVIPDDAVIGPGLFMVHARNIDIPPQTKIGSNCTLHNNVFIGDNNKPGHGPKIENDVCFFIGTFAYGSITIGSGSQVGSGAVITKTLPPNTVAVPAAIRLIPKKFSDYMIKKDNSLSQV